MRGLGTAVNVATVVTGAMVGVALGDRLPERVRTTVLQVVGLMTLVIGVREASATSNVVFPLGALLLGAVVGEALRVEERLESLGERLRRRVERVEAEEVEEDDEGGDGRGPSRFVEGFVAASLLFCIGPLTILGSIRDGLGGPDASQLLLVKAALDGVMAVVFASTMGWGVGFSAIPVLLVQGTLTATAGGADRVLTDRMVTEMTAVGGVMIVGIGLRLLEVRQVRVASLLPALVLAPLAVALFAR